MTINSSKQRTPFRKVRISAITTHDQPYPLFHGFTLSSVALNEAERVTSGGVHSRHILRTPMNTVTLFLHAMLFLTSDGAKIPAHIEMGSCSDISSTLETMGRELALLTTDGECDDHELLRMAAANIAMVCLNSASKSVTVDLLADYLQTVVGLFETEGAVSTLIGIGNGPDDCEFTFASSATHSPEQVCRAALDMMTTLINDARLPPNALTEDVFRKRRGTKPVIQQYEEVGKLAIREFLSTINDRAPIFWMESDDLAEDAAAEDEMMELADMRGRCIRVMD